MALWEVARLSATELEKRLTEFQIVARPDGILIGCIGLRISGQNGLIHSEAYYKFDNAAEYRPLLWGRVQILARNHSLVRIWSQEPEANWTAVGFHLASQEEQAKLPPGFGGPGPKWLVSQLRSEALLTGNLERELELLQATQRESTERLRKQALVVKWIIGVIAAGFCMAAFVLFYSLLKKGAFKRRR